MDVFMCDCCKELRGATQTRWKLDLAGRVLDLCQGCFNRVQGFIQSLTVPFKEKPEAP